MTDMDWPKRGSAARPPQRPSNPHARCSTGAIDRRLGRFQKRQGASSLGGAPVFVAQRRYSSVFVKSYVSDRLWWAQSTCDTSKEAVPYYQPIIWDVIWRDRFLATADGLIRISTDRACCPPVEGCAGWSANLRRTPRPVSVNVSFRFTGE